MVDLFSGRGGASAAMQYRGWRVVRLDITGRPDVLGDVRQLPIRSELRPDLLWCSPPCLEFSRAFLPWLRGHYPAPSLELVDAARAAVDALKPRYWILENVRGAVQWLGPARQVIGGRYFLWGVFPRIAYYMPHHGAYKERLSPSPDRAALRATIPYPLSHAVALAIESMRRRA